MTLPRSQPYRSSSVAPHAERERIFAEAETDAAALRAVDWDDEDDEPAADDAAT